jgi:hypothetical protein
MPQGSTARQLRGCQVVGFILPEFVIQESTISARRAEFSYAGANDVWSTRHANRQEHAIVQDLEHDPEKWKPVFAQDHAQTSNLVVL